MNQRDISFWVYGEGKFVDTGRLGTQMKAEPHTHKIQKKKVGIKIDLKRITRCPLVIMMIGPPGSGKTSIANTLLEKYPTFEYLSMDAGVTKAKLAKAVKKLVGERKSFIIDNTHPSVASRGVFLSELTDEYKKMAIWFDIPKDLSEHMTQSRVELGGKYVPKVALNMYYSKLQAPGANEFGSILKLNGVFGHTKEFLDAFSKRYI
jgi:predicted kinase